jgi:nucleotide-binding universal stress UspA family protein
MQHPQAATALLEAVKAQQCDLVVLCSHGRSGLTRWALGSVAQKLTRHAPVPVLVLRVNEALPVPAEGEGDHPAKALVALDGSALAEEALIPAAQVVAALAGLSTSSTGQLHLLRVLDPSYIGTVHGERILMDQDTRQTAHQDAEAYLRGVAQRLQTGEVGALGLRVTWSVVEDADPAGMLLAVAENGMGIAAPSSRNRFDLLAMATHGRTGVRLWEIGSVADRVLQASTLPLLIAHMPRARHTAEADEHSGEAKRDLEKEAGEWPGYN